MLYTRTVEYCMFMSPDEICEMIWIHRWFKLPEVVIEMLMWAKGRGNAGSEQRKKKGGKTKNDMALFMHLCTSHMYKGRQ